MDFDHLFQSTEKNLIDWRIYGFYTIYEQFIMVTLLHST